MQKTVAQGRPKRATPNYFRKGCTGVVSAFSQVQ